MNGIFPPNVHLNDICEFNTFALKQQMPIKFVGGIYHVALHQRAKFRYSRWVFFVRGNGLMISKTKNSAFSTHCNNENIFLFHSIYMSEIFIRIGNFYIYILSFLIK